MRISNKARRGVAIWAAALITLGAASQAQARSVTLGLASGLSHSGPVAEGVAVPGSAGAMLLIADVGEDAWEEINLLSPGANFGWDAAEGPDAAGGASSPAGEPMLPVHEYSHTVGPFGGISIIGGLIASRGPAALDGLYLFTDYGVATKATNAPFWTVDPENFGAGALAWDVTTTGGALTRPIGYAQDAGGRIHLFDQDGEVWEVVSAAAPAPAAGLLLAAGVGVLASRGRRRLGQATSPKITPASTAPTSPKAT